MSQQFVSRVLKEHAQTNMTRRPNLWPGLSASLQAQGAVASKETNMSTRIAKRPLVVAGALVAAVLLAFVAATLFQPAPVEASQVLAKVEQESNPKTTTIKTFHGVFVSRFPAYNKIGVYADSRADMWYQASPYLYMYKGVNKVPGERDTNWFVGRDEQRVYDYLTGEKYRNRPASQFPIKPFIAMNWQRLAQGEGLGAAAGTKDPQFSLFDLYDTKIAGTETMAGRQVYRLELKARPVDRTQTGARWPAYDSSTLWVDKEVFLILRIKVYNSDGTVSSEESFESVEINQPIDPSVFDFSEPTGADR
jgi:outer membrane lipoprotein-sorting protein